MAKEYISYTGPIVTRQEAKAAGLKRFFVGKPCPRGHVSERQTASYKCTTCLLISQRDWHDKNPNKGIEYGIVYRNAHPERELGRIGQWAKANPEKHNAASKAWRTANPERRAEIAYKSNLKNSHKRAARAAARRAAEKNATPPWVDLVAIEKIYAECQRRSKATGIVHHVDHIIPLQNKLVCGLHVPWNLRIVTALENQKKAFFAHPRTGNFVF